jgi:hypothetical protein
VPNTPISRAPALQWLGRSNEDNSACLQLMTAVNGTPVLSLGP